MESSSFSRASTWQVLTALGFYVVALTCLYWARATEEQRISSTIGIGFGQICSVSIWCLCLAGSARLRWLLSAVAVFGCYVAMALWIVVQRPLVSSAFYLSLATMSGVFFLVVSISMLLFRSSAGLSIVRIPYADIDPPKDNSGQFGIRHIMIAMAFSALATVIFKFVSTQAFNVELAESMSVFGLVATSFYFMSWPILAASLGERWGVASVLAIVVFFAILAAQTPVFSAILGPSLDYSILVFLDVPFAWALAVHALIARAFGYRIKEPNRSLPEPGAHL